MTVSQKSHIFALTCIMPWLPALSPSPQVLSSRTNVLGQIRLLHLTLMLGLPRLRNPGKVGERGLRLIRPSVSAFRTGRTIGPGRSEALGLASASTRTSARTSSVVSRISVPSWGRMGPLAAPITPPRVIRRPPIEGARCGMPWTLILHLILPRPV